MTPYIVLVDIAIMSLHYYINNMAFNDYRAFPSHLTLHNCLHFQFTYPYFMFVCIVHDKPRSCPLLVYYLLFVIDGNHLLFNNHLFIIYYRTTMFFNSCVLYVIQVHLHQTLTLFRSDTLLVWRRFTIFER